MKNQKIIILLMVAMMVTACGNIKKPDAEFLKISPTESVEEEIEEMSEIPETPKKEEEEIQEIEEEFPTFTGYTNTIVNIKKEANSEADSYETIKYNTEVEVIDEQDNWYQVKVNDYVGYISKEFVSMEKMPEVNQEQETQESVPKEDTSKQTEESQEELVSEPVSTKAEAGTIISGDDYQNAVLAEINAYRASQGLGALALTDKLTSSASIRAGELYGTSADTRHLRPDGSRPQTSLSFAPESKFAELAGCSVSTSIVELLKGSPTHNAMMLDGSYTLCGIGYSDGPDGGRYVAIHLY